MPRDVRLEPVRGVRIRSADRAQQLLSARLAAVRAFEPALARASEINAIHKMRVASRRLRAALKALSKGPARRKAEREVKRLQNALGAVRDLQLRLAWCERQSPGDSPRGLQRVMGRTREDLTQRERGLVNSLARWIRKGPSAVEEASVRAKMRAGRGRRRLRAALAKTHAALARLDTGDPRATHLARIQVKKLRYGAELYVEVWPKQLRRVVERLKPLQERLGELHDADVRLETFVGLVSRHWVRKLAAERAERCRELSRFLKGFQRKALL